jgi:CRP-like cAMP-binding protein
MTNRTLFPETSEDARDTHERSGSAMSARRAVLNLVGDHPGLTAVELWHHDRGSRTGGLTRHEVSRRLPELRKAGLVINGPARKCSVAGSRQMTWHAATQ